MLSYVAPATFECNEIVVGATLEAFVFAKKNNLPVITNGKVVYFDHEFIDGKKKQDEAATFKMAATLSGKLAFPFCDKIFLRQDHLSIITRTSSQKLYFDKIYLFDCEEIENLKKTIIQFDVVDVLKKRYLLTPEQKVFETGEEKFIKTIEFGKQNIIYCHSVLTKKELSSYKHTEFMARKKAAWWFKENGYKSHVKGNVIKLKHHKRIKRAHYNLSLPDSIVDKTNE
jgi:hypothetical protein|tara:strand:- start:1296 stop:1979 length:684 start_codon:yes stop_codon:yes gene_type:complete